MNTIRSARPKWIDTFIVGTGEVTHNGNLYVYDVISQGFTQRHDGPHLFTIGPIDGVLAVSKTVPEPFRGLCILHELIEKHEHRGVRSCVQALEREIQLLPSYDIDPAEYLLFRREFFAGTVAYYQRKGDRGTEDERALLGRVYQSHMRLQDMLHGS